MPQAPTTITDEIGIALGNLVEVARHASHVQGDAPLMHLRDRQIGSERLFDLFYDLGVSHEEAAF